MLVFQNISFDATQLTVKLKVHFANIKLPHKITLSFVASVFHQVYGRSDGTSINITKPKISKSARYFLVHERAADADAGNSASDGGSVAHRPRTPEQHGYHGRVRKCRSVTTRKMQCICVLWLSSTLLVKLRGRGRVCACSQHLPMRSR
jgi:hypothetical protein